MKIGDLVRGKHVHGYGVALSAKPVIGIIIKDSLMGVKFRNAGCKWWVVLCEDGLVVDEIEDCMEIVRES